MSGTTTTIAIVDDHPVVIQGLKSAFLTEDWCEVVAAGGAAADARRIAAEAKPDVMLIDLSMPGDVFDAITEITQTSTSRVIVFTAYSNLDSALRALNAGALGFVVKGADFDELIRAMRAVMSGELYIGQPFATQVMATIRSKIRREEQPQPVLSQREKLIINQLLMAKTNKQIAEDLNVSEKTVKRTMTFLMKKLNAKNRVEVAVNAQKTMDWQLKGPREEPL